MFANVFNTIVDIFIRFDKISYISVFHLYFQNAEWPSLPHMDGSPQCKVAVPPKVEAFPAEANPRHPLVQVSVFL